MKNLVRLRTETDGWNMTDCGAYVPTIPLLLEDRTFMTNHRRNPKMAIPQPIIENILPASAKWLVPKPPTMQKLAALAASRANTQLHREDSAAITNRIPIVAPPPPCSKDSFGNQNEEGASINPAMRTIPPGQVRSAKVRLTFIRYPS
jgi:hypothetical protein